MLREVPPHARLQRVIEPFDDARLCLLVVSREMADAVLLQQRLQRSVAEFQSFVGLPRRRHDIRQQFFKRYHE